MVWMYAIVVNILAAVLVASSADKAFRTVFLAFQATVITGVLIGYALLF
jgi:hypothetical protein